MTPSVFAAIARPATTRIAGICVSLLLVSACSGGKPDAAPASPTGHAVRIVMSDSLRFAPAQITLAVGDTVEWVNQGSMPHTATDKPGAAGNPEHQALPAGAAPFDTGILDAGKSARVVLATPGEYTYLCIFHETGNMVGRITVR